MMDATQFTSEILSRLVAEHGGAPERFNYLAPKIVVAFDTEHHITSEQMDAVFHGDEELEKLFPLLCAIVLSPFTDLEDQSVEREKEDDEDDEGEDDEDEEDEDE